MNASQTKVVQYLDEAHAHERALVSVLTSQIAMTPRGTYRSALETHLRETRDHAERVGRRRKALGGGNGPLGSVLGVAETVVGQALALGKTPLDMLRGSGGEEKILKNAKDACATEALEIATYTALERLARVVGDTETADLAASIRADEEKMLERITRELPKLTDAVVRADVKGEHSFDVTKTGAADAARATGRKAASTARKTTAKAKRQSRQARKVPGVARAEGAAKGAAASQGDLAIARYDSLNADEITSRLAEPLADRAREGRRVRAQEREPHDDPRADLQPPGRRAVGRLRRAHGRRGHRRHRRGRREPHQAGPHLRARAQEPRRRPRGRRARDQQRLTHADPIAG